MRRSILLIAAALLAPMAANAATEAPFTESAFAAARHQDKPILVEIDASWCTTCAQQRPILSKLASEARFKDLLIYKIDFDTQKNVVRALGANMQSTLVVFHGETEMGRSVGDTDSGSIERLLEKANS